MTMIYHYFGLRHFDALTTKKLNSQQDGTNIQTHKLSILEGVKASY